jgi:hypothetical protein
LCQDQVLVFPIFENEETVQDDSQQPPLFQSPPPLTSDCFISDPTPTKSLSASRDDIYELIYSLPRDLHRDKREKKEETAATINQNNETTTLGKNHQLLDVVEEDEDIDEDSDNETIPTGEEKLDIAWQYR